jgi:hypothetical protein
MRKIDLEPDFCMPDRGRNLIRETALYILVGFMMFLLMIFAIGFGEEIDAFFTYILSKVL